MATDVAPTTPGTPPPSSPVPPGPPPPPPPWMELQDPTVRPLKVYAMDPSQGNYVNNHMTVSVKWEQDLKPGPVGSRIAVVDYDAANRRYYPPIDLNDPRILARGGLDPSESDPRFHQQMVYAVAMETIENFDTALGRHIHWRRADRPPGNDPEGTWAKSDSIWVLRLFPHAMLQANAFYSPEAHGILFGYFTAEKTGQGRNLPGQRVFTCLSHDIIAHETTHAIIDGIRTYFTEPTNPDVLAFHEGIADLAALFRHFSHSEALLDTIQKTGGRLYRFELTPDATSHDRRKRNGDDRRDGDDKRDGEGNRPTISAEIPTRNPLIELAQQFGEASGMGRGLRSALDIPPDSDAINTRIHEPHFRGSILVAAVFDAYFSVYMRRTADLFRVYRAGGGYQGGGRANNGTADSDELPGPLARLLANQASRTAAEFFQLCAKALDYCPPVDLTFGDYLRALITVDSDLSPNEGAERREALMQAFRLRGIYPESASFFSQDALCWPRVPKGELPPVRGLVFGSPNGLTKEQKDVNGDLLRAYALANAAALGFDADPKLAPQFRPYAPSFHPVFRIGPDGSLRVEMVVELVQTRRVPFEKNLPDAGSFPLRGGVTLIVSAPEVDRRGREGDTEVRFAVTKPLTGKEGQLRLERQRDYQLALGLADGDTSDAKHFQANFGLLHQGF